MAANRAAVVEFIRKRFRFGWVPQPGPQTQAYLSQADVLLYGGAAGGGKTDLLVGLATQEHTRSIIFRSSYENIASVSGISARVKAIAGHAGWNVRKMSWTNPSDRSHFVELGALGKRNAETKYERAHDFIGFDEGVELSEAKVRYVLGWLRTTKEGQRCRCVIASNPPTGSEGQWLIEWFGPWIDPSHPKYPTAPGELRWCARSANDSLIWLDGSDPIVFLNEEGSAIRPATAEEVAALREGDERCIAIQPGSHTFVPATVFENEYLNRSEYVAILQGMVPELREKWLYGFMGACKGSAI